MKTYKENIREEIHSLIQQGKDLLNTIDDEDSKFEDEYQIWYTKSYEVIRQLIPNRLEDFSKLYDNDKAKPKSYIERGINRYLLKEGIPTTFVKPKLNQQLGILLSTNDRLDSLLYDIKALVQADVFDSEIESAKYLLKNGFLRAGGTICGVIIEKHLSLVCFNHKISLKKKNPTISDFNDNLKSKNIIEPDIWRFIQYLGDLRNLCSHKKDKEPTKENIDDLINGTDKLIRTVF